MKNMILLATVFLTFNLFAFDAGKYYEKTCTVCHTIGGGDKIGPDLAGLSKRRKVEWIVKFVNYPDGMINGDEEEAGYEKADPIAKKVYALYKPQMMAEHELSKEQIQAILKYIDSKGKEPKGKITTLK
ncbi:MAG: hypothetical protein CME62_04430 [Halobacteriovoraceae bacterium]|nr:hypothetical protein [Halobacteriovoraceae bacterium]|tara:strand:- start:9693 stop:10079 length:387 start_codon:yes stop_codon:yes gene_type:complete